MRTQLLTPKEKLQNKKRDQLILIVLIMAVVTMSIALYKL
jgi:hypothetical protein